ncbi:MAG: N-methyl-L-tryptophan oxidase [Phycisphaerae bacterium]|nr:N-methyl-L-tryptophan oxidase [Phycisphaerae bacterium]
MIYDLIVIGCGTMGAATARAAAQRGAVVLAIDRHSVPNAFGEHHGEARMFRMSYSEHPDYVPLLRRSFDAWHEIQGQAGTDLFHATGALYLGRPDGPLIAGALRSARRHGLEHEALDPDAARARWPMFRVPAGVACVFERSAGVLRPEACVRAMARQARHAGATIGTNEEVRGFSTGAMVEVETDRARYRGRSLVIAAGPWTSRVLAGAAPPVSGSPALSVTRQALGWLKPHDPSAFGAGTMPCWAFEDGPGSLLYGFPVLPGHTEMRVARHRKGPPADPDTIDRAPTPADTADFASGVRSVLPDAGPVSRTGVCLYTSSRDDHFIIDRVPGSEAAFVACGFSGHGFKFAPAVGEALADLALTGATPLPIGFLSMERFGGARD